VFRGAKNVRSPFYIELVKEIYRILSYRVVLYRFILNNILYYLFI